MSYVVAGVWADLEAGPPQGLTGTVTHDESEMWADLDSGFEAVLSVAVASEDAEGECTRRQQVGFTTEHIFTSSPVFVHLYTLQDHALQCKPRAAGLRLERCTIGMCVYALLLTLMHLYARYTCIDLVSAYTFKACSVALL